jgi:hypothetical protein
MTTHRTPIRLAIPPGTPESKCIGPCCGKTIYFVPSGRIDLQTGRIKMIPVDSDGIPHWSTCIDQKLFKKDKTKQQGNEK